MYDRLFQNPASLGTSQLGKQARALGLDGAVFDECLASGKHAARIEKSLADGRTAGVDGTPGFVVARTRPGEIVEGRAVKGAQPIAGISSASPVGAPRTRASSACRSARLVG
jgi:predicted DsbA family dithiol-disulfide isomerase